MAKPGEVTVGSSVFVEDENVYYTVAALSVDGKKVYVEGNAHTFGQKAGESGRSNYYKLVPIEKVVPRI